MGIYQKKLLNGTMLRERAREREKKKERDDSTHRSSRLDGLHTKVTHESKDK